MIQSTLGISRPRAATSVQSKIPVGALQNSKKVLVRFCCFCFPCQEKKRGKKGQKSSLDYRRGKLQALSSGNRLTCKSNTGIST